MSRSIVAEIEDPRIMQLVSSRVSRGDDGTVEVYLRPEEDAWTPTTGLRLTEDDALELSDSLREAARLVAGSEPQAFVQLLLVDDTG